MEAHVPGSGGHRRRLVSERQRLGEDWLFVLTGWSVGGPADRFQRMGERIADALFSDGRGAVQVWFQMVAGQIAGFAGVRVDVPRVWRAELAGVSEGAAYCDVYGLGYS